MMTATDMEDDDAKHVEKREREVAFLKKLVATTLEHFDTVQIVATKHNGESDSTEITWAGGGNAYARQASIEECLADFRDGTERAE